MGCCCHGYAAIDNLTEFMYRVLLVEAVILSLLDLKVKYKQY